MLGNSENRIKREKEFHDQRFTNDQREVLAPIYTFANYSKSFFENIVTNIKPEDNVLEIGCGINSISKKIIDKGANVTIIDISEKAIEIAKKYSTEESSSFVNGILDAVYKEREKLT